MKLLGTSPSNRRLAVLLGLGALSAVVLGLVTFRFAYTHSNAQTNLVWNLFLAWIPLALALVLYDRYEHRAGLATLAGLGLLWLLFFPNAPYIVTDFKYLAHSTGQAFWFDSVLIGTAALTGLLLGFASLYVLHAIVRRGVGARRSWLFAFAVLGLSSFGVYLGRVLRWNSWDVFIRPGHLSGELASKLLDPVAHTRPLAIMFLFTSFLVVGYIAFYSLARAGSLLEE